MAGLELVCPGAPSDTGAYRIAWRGAEGRAVRLEENEAVLYEGTDEATTVSGRASGDYHYRIGFRDDDASLAADSCSVLVAPPSLALAFSLFGVGLVVFLSLLGVVVRGHRKTSGE